MWFLEGSNDERRLAEILYEKNRENLKIKKLYGHKMLILNIGKIRQNLIGDVGRIYGVQWRDFKGIDQIKNLIEGLKKILMEEDIFYQHGIQLNYILMSLPPCHAFSQFFVSNRKLSCQLYQRSCDMFLGVPFNIASYSLLLHLIANECDLKVDEFIHTLGDYHIYHEHFDQVKIQLKREPRKLPHLKFKPKIFLHIRLTILN